MKKILLISKKDFKSNLLSTRLLITILVFTAIVIGGAYGIGQLYATPEEYETRYGLWMHPSDLEGDEIANDMTLYVSNVYGEPIEGKRVAMIDGLEYDRSPGLKAEPAEIEETDEMGKVNFRNVTDYGDLEVNTEEGYYEFELDLRFRLIDEEKKEAGEENIYVTDDASRRSYSILTGQMREDLAQNERIDKSEISLRDSNDALDYGNMELWSEEGRVIWHAAKPDGTPDTEAKLYVGDTEISADEYGYLYHEHDETGTFEIKATTDHGYDLRIEYEFREGDPDPVDIGPASVIEDMNSLFLPMIVPIVSIAIAYDSVTKEKESNSLFYLLSRPIERWKIAVGKLLGSLAAIAIPMTLVNIASILYIRSITEGDMSFYLLMGFIGGTLGLMAIYLIIQMIISAMSKSTGTAILGGVGVWVIFSVLSETINQILGSLMGLNVHGQTYQIVMDRISLLNPSMVYMHTSNLLVSSDYSLDLIGITEGSVYLAFILWIIVPLFVLLWIFQKKI